MTDTKRYAGNNHIIGNGFHASVANEMFILRDCDGKEWLTEWHYYFGPSAINRKTLEPFSKQPGEKSRFWVIAAAWKNQGCRVVDGVGVWEEEGMEVYG